jgi:hypothetical protein
MSLVLQHVGGNHPTKLLWEMIQIFCQHHGHLWVQEVKEAAKFGASAGGAGSSSNSPQAKAVAVLQRYAKQQSLGDWASCAYPPPLSSDVGVQGQAAQVVVPPLEAGNYQGAWEAAVESKEWSHALLIAATMGEEMYAKTVKQYVSTTLGEGHPMASLLLMATSLEPQLPGAKPATDEGDGEGAAEKKDTEEEGVQKKQLVSQWAAHLSVILSQSKTHAAMAKASTTLGERLLRAAVDAEKDADAGASPRVLSLVVGAHCCFVAAERELEPVSATSSFVLLSGGGNIVPGAGMKMITAESVMLTELYEWAHHDRLQNEKKKSSITTAASFCGFQTFKLWFAEYLTEMGLLERAEKYITAIQHAFQSIDAAASAGFKQDLAQLYDRLQEAQKAEPIPEPAPAEVDTTAATPDAAADAPPVDGAAEAAQAQWNEQTQSWDTPKQEAAAGVAAAGQAQAQWNEQTQSWDTPNQEGQAAAAGAAAAGQAQAQWNEQTQSWDTPQQQAQGGAGGVDHIEERVDPNSGTTYFYNSQTQASGWTREEVA